jgi:hypothetical protein
MNPLDCGLDEYRQITMTPYEKKRERTIKANFHKPKPPSGGKKKWNNGWIVYDTKNNNNNHISVSTNDSNVFHATVGNQHYGINGYGELWDRTDKYCDFDQYDHDYAITLYEYWRDI